MAAGKCSYPTCSVNCLQFLDGDNPTVVGEMAHIIARNANGPRGQSHGHDGYSNLILLCPTHHTLVDKGPEGKFSTTTLLEWKAAHENEVAKALAAPMFRERLQLNQFARVILAENYACWRTYGPESSAAKSNPNSTAGLFWPFRKISLIVPNNRRLIQALHSNQGLFHTSEYRVACDFVEHAEGFERNCTTPTEDVPKFPQAFEGLFDDER
jgi:hypothetical protein